MHQQILRMQDSLHFRALQFPLPELILFKFLSEGHLAYCTGFTLIFYCNQYFFPQIMHSKEDKLFFPLIGSFETLHKAKNCLPVSAFPKFLPQNNILRVAA